MEASSKTAHIVFYTALVSAVALGAFLAWKKGVFTAAGDVFNNSAAVTPIYDGLAQSQILNGPQVLANAYSSQIGKETTQALPKATVNGIVALQFYEPYTDHTFDRTV